VRTPEAPPHRVPPHSAGAVGAALVVVVALLAATACSSTSARPSASAATTARRAAPADTDPQPRPLVWRACGNGFQCSRLAVPLDYAHPGGPHLQLAVIRRPASDHAHRVGALVVNPGGPGASGVGIVRDGFGVAAGLGPGLAERLDIVSWDTRGTGASQPLACGSGAKAFLALPPDPADAAAQAQLDARARAVAADCAAHAGPLLDHIDTATTARDLEQLRRALGGAKLTYAGYSYGSAIGLAYAARYPTHIRAMVLDGVVDPDVDLPHMLTAQAVAMEQSLQSLFDRCRTDARCPLRDPSATYDQLAAALARRREPAGATTIGPSDLATAAVQSTYDPDLGQEFLVALARAASGDGSLIAAFAASYRDEVTSYVGYASVLCADFPHPVGAAAYRAFAVGLAQRARRVGAAAANELLPCAFWPAPVARTPEVVTAPGSPTILVVGNTGDAATPFASSIAVAHHLDHSALLTYQGSGHTSVGRSSCVDGAERHYLVELRPPPAGALCLPT
jgi:pimeloyl-ACP methyl ester carboxylesterase